MKQPIIKLPNSGYWFLRDNKNIKEMNVSIKELEIKIKPKAFFINPSPEHEEHPISKKLFPTY